MHVTSQLRHQHERQQHPVSSTVGHNTGSAITGMKPSTPTGGRTSTASTTTATHVAPATNIRHQHHPLHHTATAPRARITCTHNKSSAMLLSVDDVIKRYLLHCSSQRWRCLCHARVASYGQRQICRRTLLVASGLAAPG